MSEGSSSSSSGSHGTSSSGSKDSDTRPGEPSGNDAMHLKFKNRHKSTQSNKSPHRHKSTQSNKSTHSRKNEGPPSSGDSHEYSDSDDDRFHLDDEDRGTWTGKYDFLVASVGTIVGLGNVWKFPLLVFKNGGGAFLIPYFVFVIIGGIPLFYLEVAIGQYMSRGAILAWNIVPLFQGIAVTSFIVVFYNSCFYNVIISWAFYYLFASFSQDLPWEHCGHEWNTVNCSDHVHGEEHDDDNDTDPLMMNRNTPVEEFWEFRMLGITDGLHEMGSIKPDLAFCLLFAWLTVYACVSNGVKVSGKVMYVTGTFPLLVMFILIIRNATLDGAIDGIIYYLKPDFTRLIDLRVWQDAGTQVFYSVSVGLGSLSVLGSYNKFHNPTLRDTVIVTCMDTGTSLLFGFLVFSILGFMAKREGRSIDDVAVSGPGLVFIAYPSAVSEMPLAPMWSSLFFIMIILLGIDSQFVEVEMLVTAFVSEFPSLLTHHKKDFYRTLFCGFFCLVGFSMVTEGGMYVFTFVEHYSAGPVILVITFCELIAISYVYGIRRFCDNIQMMEGQFEKPLTLTYLIVCWSVLSPLYCLSMIILYFTDYSDLVYERPHHPPYRFPDWTVPVGWCLSASSAIWIPLIMVYKFFKSGASLKALKLLMVPYYLEPHQRRPEDEGEECLYDYEQKLIQGNIDKIEKTPIISVSKHKTKEDPPAAQT